MKNHVAFKFFAILLCAAALLGSILSITGLFSFISIGMYTHTLEDLQNQQVAENLELLADELAVRYAAQHETALAEELLDAWCEKKFNADRPEDPLWYYVIKDSNGVVLEKKSGTFLITSTSNKYDFHVDVQYPKFASKNTSAGGLIELPQDPIFPGVISSTEPVIPTEDFSYYDTQKLDTTYVTLELHDAPSYLVQIYTKPGAYDHEMAFLWDLQAFAYQHRYEVFIPLLLSLLVLAVTVTYLCITLGKRPGQEQTQPAGLNLVPLDLYLAANLGLILFLVSSYVQQIQNHLTESTIRILIIAILLTGYVGCLLLVGFFLACLTQLQLPDRYWWKHSFLYALIVLIRKQLALLPTTWQWVVCVGITTFLITFAAFTRIWWLMLPCFTLALIGFLWVLHSYKRLLDGARRMSREGDLNTKLESSNLAVGFSDFATELNALADVAVIAAQKQMRSERMRAELITNVSHDIRTPLTSIINYVDLLKSANDPEAASAYLEVLSRQSARMKKLIDDLIELSKASTGNLAVEPMTVDTVEYLNQAIGEFSDKLDAAALTPVFDAPGQPVYMYCDSRLTWRVLSNLMSNAVKYSLPGTRLYIDLTTEDNRVCISLKNISREQLTTDAEELTERFVRGDISRNTEGSGLGLNIAKTLMELQKGAMELTVDGDLFKVSLYFPTPETP